MDFFDKSVVKVKTMVSDGKIKADEYRRLGLSDYRWADKKTQSTPHRKIKKGSIFQFDFGKNYIPEMSYEHRGIVIGMRNNLLYVLPIFTYQKRKHQGSLYDPIVNPEGNLYLIHPTDHTFISHDSVIKLDDVRSISVSRIMYYQKYRMDINGIEYKTIERLAFSRLFPEYDYQIKKLLKENEELKNKLEQRT